ncbi:DUF4148 domain-containing protein [Paraburkholderia strydomiana]|uniref:DUF4148 domain-containing protein n=1 Tax=Paraburkholderia strydomiana TaxID=1245417 RepID=UPI001BE56B4A|nr:DUF4148 domain-containing protein [Paraburkholderia strydomiana]MBT2793667.1 DUF4148 domain-containing protein [Paraburkholderia strydomiana]
MKSLIKAVAIAAVLAAPVASFAQSSQQPVTRAEVRNELIQLEQAGYNPAVSNDPNYPADVQAAERRVQAQSPVVAQTQLPVADTSGYGGVANGSSQSGGVREPMTGPKSVYFGN